MTLEKLKRITDNLPADTVLLINSEDISDVETVSIEYHDDGRAHLIFSDKQ